MTVDTQEEADELLARIGEKRNGRYYVRDWSCPRVPDDNPETVARQHPIFNILYQAAKRRVPEVGAQLREHYHQLRRERGLAA